MPFIGPPLLQLLLGVLGSDVAVVLARRSERFYIPLATKEGSKADDNGAQQPLVLRLDLVAVLVAEVASSAEDSNVD